jgi:1-acyl-sn-glycerol-3-phosphate acyltransferase
MVQDRLAVDEIRLRQRLVAPLVWLYLWAAFVVVLVVLAIGFLGTSAVAAVLALLLPRQVGAPLGRGLIRQGFRFIVGLMRATGVCRIDLSGLEPLKRARGLVVTPNHPSLLDVVLIVSSLPNTVCITKAGLWNNPMLGGTARLAGYIRNDSPLLLVRRATAELRSGANLLIFPEGTRTPPGERPLGAFKPGFALMAKAAGAPVQTVFIETDTQYLQKGWPVWRKPVLPFAFQARLGQRVQVEAPIQSFVRGLETGMRSVLLYER